MDDTADVSVADSGTPWWQQTLGTVINGAIDYNSTKLQLQNHQGYSVDPWGRLTINGQPANVSTAVGVQGSQTMLLLGLAAVGLLIMLAVRK